MEVEVISKEAIKPSKPTPSCCKVHRLSILDQVSPSIYAPILLFYRAPTSHQKLRANISSQLKNSLSETLSHYYPFAGRLKDGVCIECDDEGALFVEAQAKKNLVDFLTLPKLEELNTLFPEDLQWKSSKNSSVLAIQLSYFDCGCVSIGICISHKIADACTISTFLNDWASHARSSGKGGWSIQPLFNTASIFPPSEQFLIPELEFMETDVVTRRYVFHPTKISELKTTIASNSKVPQDPTRVEAVTSLIYKAIIQANKIRSLGLVKAYKLTQMVNMRPRMVPPLPQNLIGNVVWYFTVMVKDIDDISLKRLATQMREELVKLCEFAGNVEGKKWLSMEVELQNNGSESEKGMNNAYTISSWCKYPVYEVDFGWGSPIWVSTAEYPYKNNIILMDSKDGEGIEAWLTLDEEVMYIIQTDEEFLNFASLNPSI